MKETQQVCQGILDLLETMEQALQHISLQLSELRLEESLAIFIDFTDALRSVEESLGNVLESGASMHQSLSAVVEAYQV